MALPDTHFPMSVAAPSHERSSRLPSKSAGSARQLEGRKSKPSVRAAATSPGTVPADSCEPKPPHDQIIEVVLSGDPNDKAGPPGFGKKHHIAPDAPLTYDVQFENVPTASAPAHEVTVTDQLDPGKVDLSTLSLGTVYFGDKSATPPAGVQTWRDDRPATGQEADRRDRRRP